MPSPGTKRSYLDSESSTGGAALSLRRHPLDRRDEGSWCQHAMEAIAIDDRHPARLTDQHLREGIVQGAVRRHGGVQGTDPLTDPPVAVDLIAVQLPDRAAVAVEDDQPPPLPVQPAAGFGQRLVGVDDGRAL